MPITRCNGADLYYEAHGDGDPIVFLHGAWAGLRYFEAQLTGLSTGYRPIALDFRGHGRSEKTEAGHTLPQYAGDFHAFLERGDLDDVVVVGWSLGALVSWEYVDRYGTDRIRALVDVDMEHSPSSWEGDDTGRYDAETLADIHAAVQDDHWAFAERARADLLKEPPTRAVETLMFDETTRCPPSVKSAIILDATMRAYRAVLPEIDVPTLVCAGVDEKWRSVAAVEEVAALVPDAEFVRFEESGHCPTVEEPDRFNRVVADFVDSL